MKAGVLAAVDGSFQAVDSFTETVTEADVELERALTIDRVFSVSAGDMAFAGRAAAERLTTQTSTTIEGGDIHVAEEDRSLTTHTEFVGIAGEFVVVDSRRGAFAWDLIAADTDTEIERVTFDLDAFFERHESATPWKAGFDGGGETGVNGVFHGRDLRANHDLRDILEDSTLTQLGLSYEYDGRDVKMTASRSGYVELYRPADFDSADYLEYLCDEVLPHVE